MTTIGIEFTIDQARVARMLTDEHKSILSEDELREGGANLNLRLVDDGEGWRAFLSSTNAFNELEWGELKAGTHVNFHGLRVDADMVRSIVLRKAVLWLVEGAPRGVGCQRFDRGALYRLGNL